MKKYIGVIVMLLIFMLPHVTFANKQSSITKLTVDDINYNEIVDPLTGNATKKPIIKISWQKGTDSSEPDTRPGIQESGDVHPPEKYEIYIQNISKTSDKTLLDTVDANVTTYDVGSTVWLDTGSLYQIQVIPVHYHDQTINTVTSKVKADYVIPDLNAHPKVIALTDYNIQLSADGKEISVIWEDAGSNVDYDLYYATGEISDYSNMTGLIQNVRSTSTQFIDPNDKKVKLKYIINNNDVKAGQLYSICIRPKVVSINGITVYTNPRTNVEEVNTKIPFKILQESDKYVKLTWWGIDTSIGITGDPGMYGIKELQIIRKDNNSTIEKIISALQGINAINIGYYSDLRPSNATNYKINIVYNKIENGIEKTINMSSDWEVYDPGATRITPAKPEIPELNSILSKDDNDILDLKAYSGTLKIDETKKSINLVWSTFERMDYNNTTGNPQDLIQDLDVYYDIWLTDDIDIINNNNLCVDKDYYVEEGADNKVNYIKNKAGVTIGFNKEYTKYVTAIRQNGLVKGYELKDVEPNKIYYIKIVAKKKILDEVLKSEPVTMAIYYNSNETVYAPPVLPKPPLKIKQLGTDNIVLEWKLSWWEVVSLSDLEQKWYNKVWYLNGDIYFTKAIGADEITLNTKEDVDKLLGKIAEENRANYSFRQISLGDNMGYELKLIPYTDVEAAIIEKRTTIADYDLEDYITDIKATSGKENGWNDMKIDLDTKDLTKQTLNYTESKLTPNTSYMFVIKPYRTIGTGNNTQKLYAQNPTAIIATTLLDEDVELPVPTVPDLFTSNIRDVEVDLKWSYNTKMVYEVKVNETETLSSARDVKFELPSSASDPNFPADGKEFLITAGDLLPKTEYYFWIRAKQKEGSLVSAWSNALLVKTSDILPSPILPPEGIGVASVNNPIGENYLTLEWTRLPEDIAADTTNKNYTVKKLYSYILVIADNVKFLDARQVEITDSNIGSTENQCDIISKSQIKVNGLTPNTKYYFKIKSKVIAVKGNSAASVENVSIFSAVKAVKTLVTPEYDSELGNLDITLSDITTLTYDTEVLTYSIPEENRIIGDILKQNDYHFTIDTKEYKSVSSSGTVSSSGKKISKRVINVPYSVINTLIGQKMTLDILTDDMKFSMPAAALETPVLDRATKIGGIKNYVITINNVSSPSPMTKGKEINIAIETRHGNVQESFFKEPIIVSYDTGKTSTTSTTTASSVVDNNKVFIFDMYKNKWNPVTEQINTNKGYILFKTRQLGKYGISTQN